MNKDNDRKNAPAASPTQPKQAAPIVAPTPAGKTPAVTDPKTVSPEAPRKLNSDQSPDKTAITPDKTDPMDVPLRASKLDDNAKPGQQVRP